MTVISLHGFAGHPGAFDVLWPGSGIAITGHAADLPVPSGYRFGDEVLRIASVIEAVGQPVHLAGYSMGGRLALAVAGHRPELVAELTIVSAHPGLFDPAERAARLASDETWAELLESRGIEAFADAWRAQPMWNSQSQLPAQVRAAQRNSLLAHDAHQLAAAMRALGLGAMSPVHRTRLTMPVHLLTGALDSKFTALAQAMVVALPNARHTVIEDCGHNPLIERPDRMRDVLLGTQRIRRAQ